MLAAVHAPVSMHKQAQDRQRDADEILSSTGTLRCSVMITKCCLFSGVFSDGANASLLSVQMVVPQGEMSRDATKISVSVTVDVTGGEVGLKA